jgi:hypothetical protein
MGEVLEFAVGGYRFLKGVFPYSAGVAALPGFEIERALFFRPPPLEAGFQAVKAHLASLGRPLTALCSFELRSPAPFSEAGFKEFNKPYVRSLEAWGLFREKVNPVARTNVCPELDPPPAPSVHAFSYTLPAQAPPTFVIAGSGEVPEGRGNYPDRIVRKGDVSPDGLREKARWVLGEMERRLAALGFSWNDVTASQAYTVHDVHPFLADELVRRGAARHGITWHYARPPVLDLDFEMDCRSVRRERVL